MKKEPLIGVVVVLVFFSVILIAFSAVSIPAGHVGLHDLFGQVSEQEMQPGLHFKNPVASVHKMSVKTQQYSMSGVDAITALTKEGLTVSLDITVLYKLNPSKADEVYTTIGEEYVSVIVRPQIRTVIREMIAGYEAKELYSEARQTIATEIAVNLEPELAARNIILENVLLRNIQLPDQLVNSIEQKLVAEQDAERMVFVLQKESQEAERKVIEAEGIRNSTMIVQEGLSKSPEYLTYLWLQKLENHESVVYVVEGNMGLPLFTKEIQ